MLLRNRCSALCVSMLAGWTVAAADGVPFEDWKLAGAFTGSVNGIAVSRTSPPQIVVSEFFGGLFRSDNGGDDWTQIGSGSVKGIALNPSDPSLLLATKEFPKG